MDESQLINCCRTCLKESCQMRSMASQWNNEIQFWEMLITLTGIDRRNTIPFNICDKCEHDLVSAYTFKLLCQETEALLNKFFDEDDEDSELAVKTINELNGNQDVVLISYHPGSRDDYIDEHAHDAVIEQTWDDAPNDDKSIILEEDAILKNNVFHIENYHSTLLLTRESSVPPETILAAENATEPTYYEVAEKDSTALTNTAIMKEETNVDPPNETTNEKKAEKLARNKRLTKIQRECRICNLFFVDLKAYQIHHRQQHNTRTLCTFCGKLVSKHALEKHLISHTKSKDHLCTECGKSFTLSENLKKHWRIHTGDKRYSCDYCGEKFIHWNSKRSHIRTTHTGEKKYECNICGKRFAQSSNMFRHVRQHTGELPHECRFCAKKFMTTTELRNHIVVHTKEKNEQCQICHKNFGTRKALRAHSKTHTGERNYVCTVCKKAFTQAHVLRTHMKTHPDCPIPPPGVILSQKALNRPPKLVGSETTIDQTNLIKEEYVDA